MSRKRPDEPFVQVWERLIHAEISDGALRTYMVLREHAWSVGSVYRDGYAQLAQARGIKPRALSNHVDELVAVGAITKQVVGRRRENRLTIMPFDHIDPSGDRHGSAMHTGGDPHGSAMHTEGDLHGSAMHTAPVIGTSVHGDRHGCADMIGTDVPIRSFPDTHSLPDISTDASEQKTYGPGGRLPGQAMAGGHRSVRTNRVFID